jgi:hypothetical protein
MKNKNIITFIAIVAIIIASCTKTEVNYEANRPTIVRTPDAENEINIVARDVLPTMEEFDLLTIDRISTKPEDLNTSLTVKVAKLNTLITDYNTAHGTSYIEVPATAYTLSVDLNNIVFAPGEFIKKVKIKVDKAQLDLSKQYALGFTITEVGSGAKISILKNALFSIGVKNQYDGKYMLNGAFYHPTSSPGYDAFSVEVEMHTSGPNSVKMYVPGFGGYYHPGLFSGTLNAFGAQEPNYTIDPVTKAVTVQNSFSGATTFYTMALGYNSRYEPAGKKIYAKFGYNYGAGGVFNPATNREWTDELVYTGPR